MRVLFCGGGTGGHVYPALTVAQALREISCPPPSSAPAAPEALELLYVGVKGKIDAELVGREGIPFKAVAALPLRTGTLAGATRGAMTLASGTMEAYRILNGFRPDVVFATGGYGSAGVGMAARLQKRPLLLFLPDVEAGLAVKALAKIADQIAVSVPVALNAVPKEKTKVTGYPVRPQFFSIDRAAARAHLGLHENLPALLVSGASSGANAINRAVAAWAPDFLRLGQLVHICGARDEPWLRQGRERLSPELQSRYHLHAYLHDDMPYALAAADIAVMRAGASTLGELPATRLPAVLVPGEYEGWDQSPNARYLEGEGAAVMLPQSRLEADLGPTVMGLLGDSDRRQRMQEALSRLARPDAALKLAQMLLKLAGDRSGVAK
jgi:UDP-N-acetylglucosamine--N-acetylmuramyl-(pentapeptide) pyrophosphoryl-undecaprenol N-acetylglucosamine transferase